MKCRFCPKQFFDDKDGLASKTIHEIIHNPSMINSSVNLVLHAYSRNKRKEKGAKEKRK